MNSDHCKLITDEITAERPIKFWLVCSDHGLSACFCSETDAIAEARRLLRSAPRDRFFILEAMTLIDHMPSPSRAATLVSRVLFDATRPSLSVDDVE